MRSLIKRRQIDADISGAVYEYGQMLFPSYDQLSGATENVVYTTGSQIIDGQKTFLNRPIVNDKRVLIEGDIISGGGGTGSFNLEDVVFTTGNQNIFGEKFFQNSIYLSGKKILVEGDSISDNNQPVSGSKNFFTSGVYFSGVDVIFDKNSNLIIEGNAFIDTINGHTSFGIYNLLGVQSIELAEIPLGIRTGNILNLINNNSIDSYLMIEYSGPSIPGDVYPVIHPFYQQRAFKKINWGSSNNLGSSRLNFNNIILSENRNINLLPTNNTEYDISVYGTGEFNINLPDLNQAVSGDSLKFKLSFISDNVINSIHHSGVRYKISFNSQNLLDNNSYSSIYNIYSETVKRDFFVEFKNKNSNFWVLESIPFLNYAKLDHSHNFSDVFLLEETMFSLTGYEKVNTFWFLDDFLISETPASRNLYIDCVFDTTGECIIHLPNTSGENVRDGDILYYNMSLNIKNPKSLDFRSNYLSGNNIYSEYSTVYSIQSPNLNDFAEFIYVYPYWKLKNSSDKINTNNTNYLNEYCEQISFTGFKNLKSNNLLEKGKYYEIIDFISKWWNNSAVDISVKSGKYIEPLTVLATDNNKISNRAFSKKYPEDIIYYDDEAKTSYTWNTNEFPDIPDFKGWIYRRQDTKNMIDLSCDWRNITVNCGRLDLSSISLYSQTTTYNRFDVVKTSFGKIFISSKNSNLNKLPGLDANWWQPVTPFVENNTYFAVDNEFEYLNISLANSYLALTLPIITGSLIQQPLFSTSLTGSGHFNISGVNNLNIKNIKNSIFLVPSGQGDVLFYSNEIDCNFNNNTINGQYFYSNKIGDDFKLNKIESFYSNEIGDNFYNNSVEGFVFNKVASEFNQNIISRDFGRNNIGTDFKKNLISDNFQDNNIFNRFEENIIDAGFSYNFIRNLFSNNIIERNFQRNTVFDNCKTNYIGMDASRNTIEANFQSNFVRDNFLANKIGPDFSQNKLNHNFRYNEGSFSLFDLTGISQGHIYSPYSTRIFNNSNNQTRLSYYNHNDQLVVTDLNA